MNSTLPSITLLGAGNVGAHLAVALHQAGYLIRQIYNRRPERLTVLETLAQNGVTTSLSGILPDSDVYIISVTDDAIGEVAREIAKKLSATNPSPIVVHTSGTVHVSVLSDFTRRGVFYPLQTFSHGKPIIWENVPFILQGSDEQVQQILHQVAQSLSTNIYYLDDDQRKMIHIGAVFVNNFANYLMTIASDILAQHQLPFDILKPLILETAQKVQMQSPEAAQTGPAKRGDIQTIAQHIQLLQTMPPHIQALYRQISDLIAERYRNN